MLDTVAGLISRLPNPTGDGLADRPEYVLTCTITASQADFGAHSARYDCQRHRKSFTVTFMLRKAADGVWWIEDADGLPMALVTALDDGTPMRAAEQWRAASRNLLRDLAGNAIVQERLEQLADPDQPEES